LSIFQQSMKDKMEKILGEGHKSDKARYCIGFITGRGIVRDKSTIVIKAAAPEMRELNKLFNWLGVADISIFTCAGSEFVMMIKSSTLVKYLYGLLRKEGNSAIIWGKRIREWGEWPEGNINNDAHFVRGYMEGVRLENKDAKNLACRDFEMDTM